MASPYQIAAGIAGTREGQSALTDYLKTGGQNIDPTTRAWCADFVNATMTKAGQKGTDSGMARSFLQWGRAVTEPQQGDVAVFSRGSDPAKGHVGFFDSVNPDGSIRVLGGNQSDSVSYGNYPAERLLGYRRAGDAAPGKVGGDSMVARDFDPQVAGQTNAPVFGSMSPGMAPQNNGVPGFVVDHWDSLDKEKKDPWGDAGRAFTQAANEFPAPRINGAFSGDARQSGDALTKVMQNPSALAQMLLRKRMA